ncbi:hypothetical protein ACRS3X_23915 [Ectopseudomonas hydrolytica]|uniref:hypothetical protein n=1 Tax=Ectopseudomonas hydrolytica TaxID=2493633 RepID=UPI003EDE9DBA
MKPELHDEVHEIVLKIVNASEVDDQRTVWSAYQELVKLCEDSEKAEINHPFQWETLGDFTSDKSIALKFYGKALDYAVSAELYEYISSICLAMAEAYLELGSLNQAKYFAAQANEAAVTTSDLELRKEISELLLQLSDRT